MEWGTKLSIKDFHLWYSKLQQEERGLALSDASHSCYAALMAMW